MDEKNPHGLALGFRRARAKSNKIKELKITPDFTDDQIDTLVKTLSEAKAKADGNDDWKPYSKGQQWYIEDLVKFSAMTAREKLDYEYEMAFPETADEDEMLAALEAA